MFKEKFLQTNKHNKVRFKRIKYRFLTADLKVTMMFFNTCV